MRRVFVFAAVLLSYALPASAAIVVGPFTFAERAFADVATQLDAGDVEFLETAADLNDALTGFSPDRGIFNIGASFSLSFNANSFLLGFADLLAVNGPGDDLVFFDARFSVDPYSIALREVGGAMSSSVDFPSSAFVDTGFPGPVAPSGESVLFALPIDLDDFGLPAGAVIDGLHFMALPSDSRTDGGREGDPVMAGVLNAVPEPSTVLLLAVGLAGLAAAGRRRS